MNTETLQLRLETLFGGHASPGQAFDALLDMRQNGVTLAIVKAHLAGVAVQLDLPAGNTPTPQMRQSPQNGPMTSDSLMPFGRHAGKVLKDVPMDYIRWLQSQGDELRHKPLREFLKTYKRDYSTKIGDVVDLPPLDDDDDEDVPF